MKTMLIYYNSKKIFSFCITKLVIALQLRSITTSIVEIFASPQILVLFLVQLLSINDHVLVESQPVK